MQSSVGAISAVSWGRVKFGASIKIQISVELISSRTAEFLFLTLQKNCRSDVVLVYIYISASTSVIPVTQDHLHSINATQYHAIPYVKIFALRMAPSHWHQYLQYDDVDDDHHVDVVRMEDPL